MQEKLDMKTTNWANQNTEQIALLFPDCVVETTEGTKLDFDLLKQQMSADIVDGFKERYRLEWPGKKEAIITANLPTTSTLRPNLEKSVDFENTENIYIEGDNLEVLKLLQESYLGKIDVICIDPPYNTGKDFVYNDNFDKDKQDELFESGQTSDYGERLFVNAETSGRYHSDWLSLIYPRLKLARNLLTDKGVIFISIDDREIHNLRKLCDEIFGEQNFIAQIVWERAYSPVNLKKHFSESHDYIVCYARDLTQAVNNGLPRSDEANSRYSNPDEDPRGDWKSSDLSVGPAIEKNIYEITLKGGRKALPPSGYSWRLSRERFDEFVADNRIWFGTQGTSVPSIKRFLSEVKSTVTPMTIWKYSEVGHSQEASQSLKKLFDNKAVFDYPKPVELIKRCIQLYSDQDSIVLDFFSGSATTAHAVMTLNSEEENSKRKYILVQLPEDVENNSNLKSFNFKTICDVGRERIIRAAAKIKKSSNASIDYGFRYLVTDSSNLKDVYYSPQDFNQKSLEFFENNVKPDRSAEDLLFQVMIDWGLPLSSKIEKKTVLGKVFYAVEGDSLYACFDNNIDEDFAKEIAKDSPLRIVFNDDSFDSDTAKTNVKQLLKQLSPSTEMKVL